MVATACLLFAAACGSDGTGSDAAEGGAGTEGGADERTATSLPDGLVVERPDGSELSLDAAVLPCGFLDGSDRGILVVMFNPAPEGAGSAQETAGLFVTLEVVTDEVEAGRTYELPVSTPEQGGDGPVSLFYAGGGPQGEASSAESGSSGTVEILDATCEPRPRLRARIDASLASERPGREPVAVRGRVDAEGP